MSSPSRSARPVRPVPSGKSPISAFTTVLLPHPLSPTRPRLVPAGTVKPTSSTAWNGPRAVL